MSWSCKRVWASRVDCVWPIWSLTVADIVCGRYFLAEMVVADMVCGRYRRPPLQLAHLLISPHT